MKGHQNIFRVRKGTVRIIFAKDKNDIFILSVDRRREGLLFLKQESASPCRGRDRTGMRVVKLIEEAGDRGFLRATAGKHVCEVGECLEDASAIPGETRVTKKHKKEVNFLHPLHFEWGDSR